MPEHLIPARYSDAETSLPEVDRWCSAILAGSRARLLLLGPCMSGKTHTAYAALRRLLAAGYPPASLGVYRAYEMARDYNPQLIEQAPPVIFLDDLTDRSDNVAGVKNLEPDEPEIQALMAMHQGAVVDAAERLAGRAGTSWIACASNRERLAADLGEDVAVKLLAVADVVELSPRPQRPVLDW
ncbi:ATP-binding protein [Micromonospora sp. KC213]|uniref:ATP-binding protein n=1 Tax=Micromonospora sp. KC213 TaxID=2530378 RepID=UPI0010460964|nr:ATP-binding protein [Micromonospora sp. KC213]TDC42074.1 ATP-binding protein [Micromonospora sp. KC213]